MGERTDPDAPQDECEAAVEPEVVREALSRIQESAPFVASRQLSAFLAYVVEKSLAGEADRIKAYSIATEALGRPETFDPASDPIVRVEAGRLRKALDAYYQADGARAPIRITMPRGSYVPRFQLTEVLPEVGEDVDAAGDEAGAEGPPVSELPSGVAALWWIRIGGALAVVAIIMGLSAIGSHYSGQRAALPVTPERPVAAATKPVAPRIFVAPFAVADEAAVGVTGRQFSTMLATAISRFDEVTVVTRMDGEAEYLVSGTLSAGSTGISASTLLTDRASGRVIWSQQTTLPRNPIRPSVTISELKGEIATAIAQPYGVVLSDRLSRTDLPDDGFPCMLRTFNYWRSFAPEVHAEQKTCLVALTQRYPAYALAYAQLTNIYVTEALFGFNPEPGSSALDRAVKASALGVQLAPTSARAMQSLQYTYYATGEIERAIQAGNAAITLNPLDTDIRASQGLVLIAAGRYQLGQQLIEEAASHNTAYPPWYDLYLGLAAFQAGKADQLRTLMSRVNLPAHPLAAFLEMVASAPGDREAALAGIRTRFPAMAADPASVLVRLVPNRDVVDKLVAAGRQAGLGS
jgi:Tfp pilus assembly protein PilF/TolB-like protein